MIDEKGKWLLLMSPWEAKSGGWEIEVFASKDLLLQSIWNRDFDDED